MFRFTIRDVLLVMVIVGLAVGWWLDRSQLRAERSKAINDTAQALSARARAEREAAELVLRQLKILGSRFHIHSVSIVWIRSGNPKIRA
jgi:hypothetical protein